MIGSLEELQARHPNVARVAPAVAFFGGFLWDAVTLGSRITSFDLVWVAGYYLAACVVLLLIGREIEFRFSPYLNFVLQFLFGGIFSPLVVFYFLSSGELWGFLFVAVLVGLLVGNEFLESRYSRLTLSWTIFAVCGIMLLNFALPHLFRTLSSVWFYVSTGLAIAVVAGLRVVSIRRASLAPSVAIAAILVALFLANVIPPVPLVKEEMLLAHDVTREGTSYAVSIEPAPAWKFWLRSAPTFHRAPGERVYCFTAVFVPEGIATGLIHRWEFREPGVGWKTTDLIAFPIRGGRREGYRGFTYKGRVWPGSWRVRAESEDGKILGLMRFEVVDAPPGSPRTKRIAL